MEMVARQIKDQENERTEAKVATRAKRKPRETLCRPEFLPHDNPPVPYRASLSRSCTFFSCCTFGCSDRCTSHNHADARLQLRPTRCTTAPPRLTARMTSARARRVSPRPAAPVYSSSSPPSAPWTASARHRLACSRLTRALRSPQLSQVSSRLASPRLARHPRNLTAHLSPFTLTPSPSLTVTAHRSPLTSFTLAHPHPTDKLVSD